jgi:hypothetical protein
VGEEGRAMQEKVDREILSSRQFFFLNVQKACIAELESPGVYTDDTCTYVQEMLMVIICMQ